MALDKENLPALHRLLDQQHRQYAVWLETAESERYSHKDVEAVVSVRWMNDAKELIDELTYVLRKNDERIAFSGQTLLIALAAFALIMSVVSILAVLVMRT